MKLLYATIPRPEEVDEYYYDEDAELSMVLYNGLFEIDMAFYPSVVASFKMSQKDIMYTTHVGLSAIIINVALTDELFLKVCRIVGSLRRRSLIVYFVVFGNNRTSWTSKTN